MKNKIIAVFCILFCTLFSSCNNATIDSNDTEKPMENNSSLGSNTDNCLTVSTAIGFSSMDEIERFLVAARSSEAVFQKYLDSRHMDNVISQKVAQKAMTNITSQFLPVASSDVETKSFGATYYADRDQLDIVYNINNCRYRFIFSYHSVNKQEYEGLPVVSNVTVGDYLLDLYQGDDCFIGSVTTDTATMTIIVYANQLNVELSKLFEFKKMQ